MQDLQSKKSPLLSKKVINSSLMPREKPFNPSNQHALPQQALSYQIGKQYHQQNRTQTNQNQKILQNSRNNNHQQQSVEDSQYFQTKTISINLNQLAHSSSQASLKSTQHMSRGGRNDLEQAAENAKKLKNSFRENSGGATKSRVQTARQRKSPSPQKILYNLEAHKQYQSIVDEKLSNTRNQVSRSKQLLNEKVSNSRLSTRIISAKKDSIAIPPSVNINQHQQLQQATFRTTVSSVTSATNLKSRTSASNQVQQPKIVNSNLRPSTASNISYNQNQYQMQLQQQQSQQMPILNTQPQFNTMNSFDSKKQIKITHAIQSVDKKSSRVHKRPSEMASPGSILQNKSPRLTLGAGSTTGATSIYTVTTESIINQSGTTSNMVSQAINQRKMCLSEKLAPKGKKKRNNAHRQPKQITITRDQIILQPFLSIYSTQNGGLNSALPSGIQSNNFNTQQDQNPNNQISSNRQESQSMREKRTDNIERTNNSFKSSLHGYILSSKPNDDNTPMTSNNNYQDNDFHTSYQRNMSNNDLSDHKKDQRNMFSFHALDRETGITQNINLSHQIQDSQSDYRAYARNQILEDNPQLSLKGRVSSMAEETKEVTGIFGGQLLQSIEDNNQVEIQERPSYSGLGDNLRKASSKDVATPVFLQKSQASMRPSDVVLHLDVQLCDDSPSQKQKQNTSQFNQKQLSAEKESNQQLDSISNRNASFLSGPVVSNTNNYNQIQNLKVQVLSPKQNSEKKQLPQTAPMNPKQDASIQQSKIIQDDSSDQTQSLQPNQSLKKVYSTSNLELSKGNISVAQTSILQRQDSNGSFFSRIKSYFGAKPQSQIIDLRNPDVEYRCRCGQSGKIYACKRAMKWLQFANNYSEMEYEKNKQLYLGLIKFDTASGSESQIERDIPRTFPNADPYMSTQEGQQKLSRVLNAFSKYFTSIGYVQGMNFIVGALLMHCSEDIAFWLFVSLIEDFEMRDIYQPKLPGLYKHSQVLQLLQMEHLERLYYHFSNQNILIEMYASDWVFALFSNIIPITEYHHFLDCFFFGGWTFFYKFSLSFLKCHSDELLQLNDLSEILNMIKLKSVKKDNLADFKSPRIRFDESGQISELESMKRYSDTSSISPTRQQNGSVTRQGGGIFSRMFGKEPTITSESFKDDAVWEKLISLSCREWEKEFNENFVNQLLSSFDPEKLVFNSSFPNTPKEVSIVYSATKKSKQELQNDPSPPQIRIVNEKRQQQDIKRPVQKKQKQEQKLQIIVNDGIRNPRQANIVFSDSSRMSVPLKQQNRSQQPREIKKSSQQQQVPTKRYAP